MSFPLKCECKCEIEFVCWLWGNLGSTQTRSFVKRGLHHFGLLPLKQSVYLLLLRYHRKVSQRVLCYIQKLNTVQLRTLNVLYHTECLRGRKYILKKWWIELICITEICLPHCVIALFCQSTDSLQMHKMFPCWFISQLYWIQKLEGFSKW